MLEALVEMRKKKNLYVNVLPLNEQQYRAIYVNKFAFLDSYQFLLSSLDALMKDYILHKNPNEMTIINQSNLAKDKNGKFSAFMRNFLLRKGLVPWKLITGRQAHYIFSAFRTGTDKTSLNELVMRVRVHHVGC